MLVYGGMRGQLARLAASRRNDPDVGVAASYRPENDLVAVGGPRRGAVSRGVRGELAGDIGVTPAMTQMSPTSSSQLK